MTEHFSHAEDVAGEAGERSGSGSASARRVTRARLEGIVHHAVKEAHALRGDGAADGTAAALGGAFHAATAGAVGAADDDFADLAELRGGVKGDVSLGKGGAS